MNTIKTLLAAIAVIVAFSSCESSMEKILRNNVESRFKDIDVKYKLMSVLPNDTVTAPKRVKALEAEIGWLKGICDTLSYDGFKGLRDQEFKVFRRDSTYEDKIMHGEYKDASPWCTELRERTETADSILANWNTINSDSWEIASFVGWATIRYVQFYNNRPHEWYQKAIEELSESKPKYEELTAISSAPADSVVYYTYTHKYSLYNPALEKRVNMIDSVAISPDNIILGSETSVDLEQALKTLFE